MESQAVSGTAEDAHVLRHGRSVCRHIPDRRPPAAVPRGAGPFGLGTLGEHVDSDPRPVVSDHEQLHFGLQI